MWAPDVYEGAPTPVTAFLAVAPKALGFLVLLRVLTTVFAPSFAHWSIVLTALSILTMTLGNLTAISQASMKRFLAYSSIAQAGYILMGLAVFSELGKNGMIIYLFAYLFTNLGAFAVAALVEERSGNDTIASYAGLSERAPVVAALMTVFLLSLTGIPPLAGFIGKYYVFAAAIEGRFLVLAVAAAINSAIAAYYYFKIIRQMYLVSADQPSFAKTPITTNITLWLMLAGVLALGLFPGPFIKLLVG
jgi:proton-translocating NADH-quinone oxidoreductase chain N